MTLDIGLAPLGREHLLGFITHAFEIFHIHVRQPWKRASGRPASSIGQGIIDYPGILSERGVRLDDNHGIEAFEMPGTKLLGLSVVGTHEQPAAA